MKKAVGRSLISPEEFGIIYQISKAVPKNDQITIQLHSFHMLARLCSRSFKLGFSSTWIENFQMYKLDLEKAEEPKIKISNIHWIIEKAREFQKNIYFCFIDHGKAFDCVGHNKLWKFFKEMGTLDHLTCLLRGSCMQHKKQQLEPNMEQRTGSKLGREYIKTVYCYPAYVTSIQSTSCKMPGWMKLKLESRLPGEISTTSDTQVTPPLRQKAKRD